MLDIGDGWKVAHNIGSANLVMSATPLALPPRGDSKITREHHMYETTNTEFELVASKGRVIELEQQLATMTNQRDKYVELYNKTRDYVQGSIDRGDWQDSELEEIFWDELSDLLDLEIKREVEITITTYWRATVKMPRGEDISELENYIAVDDPELSHPTAEFIDIEVGDTSVSRY